MKIKRLNVMIAAVVTLASGSVFGATIEDFEAYSLTSDWAGGVGGWRSIVTGNGDPVEIANTGLTGHAMRMDDEPTVADRLAFWTDPLDAATHYAKWNLNIASVTGSTIVEIRLRRAGDAAFLGSVKFLADGSVIRVHGNGVGGNTTEQLAPSFPVTTWHTVEMDVDFPNDQFRVRYNGGTWTGFANFGSDTTASATADDLFFVRGADVSFDDFIHDAAVPVPEPASLSLIVMGSALMLRRRRTSS